MLPAIPRFSESLSSSIYDEFFNNLLDEFSDSESADLRRAVALMGKIANQTHSQKRKPRLIKPISEKPKALLEKPKALLLKILSKEIHSRFLAEMALSYLVSRQEGFLKDYLLKLLTKVPIVLTTKEKSLTYQEILTYKNMQDIWKHIAEAQVEDLGRGSIDEIEKFFLKKLGINLKEFVGWPEIREQNYRRNLIIHNRSRINEHYRKSVGSKAEGQIRTKIDYVEQASITVIALIKHIHDSAVSKFKLEAS